MARLSKSAADKKYRCSDCDRSFFTRKDAERHSVVHNRSRDFLCQFCPRTYGRSDHLSRHIEKSHGSHETEAGPSSNLELATVNQVDEPPASTVLPGFSQAFRDVWLCNKELFLFLFIFLYSYQFIFFTRLVIENHFSY